jgi:hypothetical protein
MRIEYNTDSSRQKNRYLEEDSKKYHRDSSENEEQSCYRTDRQKSRLIRVEYDTDHRCYRSDQKKSEYYRTDEEKPLSQEERDYYRSDREKFRSMSQNS